MHTISPAALATQWPGVPLIDVRGREEYAVAHIPGSINLPLDNLEGALASVPNQRTVYVICGSGKRSERAVGILRQRGVDAVSVNGGITEWYRGGYPVSYAAPDSPAQNAGSNAHRTGNSWLSTFLRWARSARRNSR